MMPQPWKTLEAEMRRMPLDAVSDETQRRIVERLGREAAPPATTPRRWWAWPAAAAACLALAAGVWLAMRGPMPGPSAPEGQPSPTGDVVSAAPSPVTLATGWRVQPAGDAAFRVVDGNHVRLDRGEVLIASVPPAADASPRAALTVKTPGAAVTATGTIFYVGTHALDPQRKGQPMTRMTRVLVLAGVVALTNPLGSVTGQANDLLAAETGAAPVKHAVQANSDFAFDLYRQLSGENAGKNLFFSPYSVSSALAMTAEGARGPTAAEMGKVLRFPQAARRIGADAQLIPWQTSLIHAGMGRLNARLTGKDKDAAAVEAARQRIVDCRKALEEAKAKVQKLRRQRNWREMGRATQAERKASQALNEALAQVDQYELRIANALWGEKTYPFRKEYVDTISTHYGTGGVFPADFKNNFPAERDKINTWVEDQTNKRIKNLIPKLSPAQAKLLRLILTNAIYFKGEWSEPFKEANTRDLPFTPPAGQPVKTPIMSARNLKVGRYAAFNADGSFFNTPRMINRGQKTGLYPDKDGFAMLELPYKGDEISMVLIAPNSPDGIAAVEKKLTPAALAAWIGKAVKRKVHVFVPKFKLETKYTMNETLKAMGMVRAFTDPRLANGADFTGMSASTDPRDRLYISKVIHKAFVEVNEKGTEAAAATAVMMVGATSVRMSVPFTPTFKANRPFLFIIRDKNTGSILFMGRMMDPTKK